jgi:hypothetical protein
VKKAERDLKTLETVMPVIRDAGNNTRDVLIAAISNPLVMMVAANVAIELLQRVELNKVPEEWEWRSQPGTHALVYVRKKTALLSQAHATTMQSVATSATVIQSLGGISGISGLLTGITKLLGK